VIVASWNVNSLTVRLPQVLNWLAAPEGGAAVDVLCLQELKLTDDKFPVAAFADAGYQVVFAGQKTYNGVALISRHAIENVVRNNPLFEDEQRRLIAGTVAGVRVICGYFPNGQAVGSDKYAYKLSWLDALHRYVGDELVRSPKLVLAGDYNIAPKDQDVHDPAAWEGMVHVSPAERERYFRLINELKFTDTYRQFEQPPRTFSWWDYRNLAFRKNQGLRIDLILASESLAPHCKRAWIDKMPRKNEQPSDHTPVLAEFDVLS
jgi:exodeoxyribonuclease III